MDKRENQNLKRQHESSRKADKAAVFWQKPAVWLIAVLVCVFLWGTAFPAVKSGYDLFQIKPKTEGSIASLILFAGMRFTLAGLLTLVFTMFSEKCNPFPKTAGQWGACFLLAIPQTVLQYSFFFIGLAHTSGAIGSILAGTSSFMAILLAGLFFPEEKLTRNVAAGCVLGFLGIIVVDFRAGDNLSFNWLGDGFMLLSAFTSAISVILIKKLTDYFHPRLLSGWNFFLGGLSMMIFGKIFGGEIQPINPAAWLILLYLALLSATAFALWMTMLKYHDVSQLSVFKSLIPVIGALGSALILKENILQPRLLVALLLVASGIFLVNRNKTNRKRKER